MKSLTIGHVPTVRKNWTFKKRNRNRKSPGLTVIQYVGSNLQQTFKDALRKIITAYNRSD